MSTTNTTLPYREFVKRMTSGEGVATPDGGCPVGIALDGVTLRNRAWRSATWLGLAGQRGEITDSIVRTYAELAKGGAAILVTGLTSIAEDDSTIGGEAKFYDDSFVAGHRRLTDAVHAEGANIIMQTAIVDGFVDELTTDKVEGVVRQFGEAAARAERAGYDAARRINTDADSGGGSR